MSDSTLRRGRQKARKAALQAVYRLDLENDWSTARFMQSLEAQDPPLPVDAIEYALQLYETVQLHRSTLDQWIGTTNPNWSLERMGILERNILRLAGAELAYLDTPRLVCIAEGVRLAEMFTNEDAVAMIHAALDNLNLERSVPATA